MSKAEVCYQGLTSNTVFDLITAQCDQVFQNDWENLWLKMYPPVLRVHLKEKIFNDAYVIFFSFWFFFFLKAYAVGIIWITLTSQCSSNRYTQHMPL